MYIYMYIYIYIYIIYIYIYIYIYIHIVLCSIDRVLYIVFTLSLRCKKEKLKRKYEGETKNIF